MAVVTSDQVARAFVHFHTEDVKQGEILPPLDKMKLDKMVYYAQAHWLGWRDERLFDDREIVAEEMGPVVDGLPKVAEMGAGTPHGLPGQVVKYLRGVHDALKTKSSLELSEVTRGPGEPWHYVWMVQQRDVSSRPVIPTDLIRGVFVQKIFQMRQAA